MAAAGLLHCQAHDVQTVRHDVHNVRELGQSGCQGAFYAQEPHVAETREQRRLLFTDD